jgi:leucyl-tRNA---protein transferase
VSDLSAKFPRFFMTAPTGCPYVAGRTERKVFTELAGPDPRGLLDMLSQAGFRRSQNVAYRPSCGSCSACISVRVLAKEFTLGRTLRRLVNRHRDLHVYACESWATEEQFMLLKRYLADRHPSGGMASMDVYDYADMVERSPVNTMVYEYREPSARGLGRLVGVCLTDQLSDGLSMVYSFYEPHGSRDSLGSFIVTDHILRAAQMNLDHVYLGYWIPDSPQMRYKSRFRPMERLTAHGWVRMTEDGDADPQARPKLFGLAGFEPEVESLPEA